MKRLFIPAIIVIIGLIIYNTQIKTKQIPSIDSKELASELNISSGNITNPTDLMRNGVEIPIHIMCEKAGGTLFGGKCYEGKAKAIVVDENRTK